MKLGGQLLLHTSDPREPVRLTPGALLIDGDRISRVDLGESHLAHADLGGVDTFICPGLTDTHLHLPQFDSIGVSGLELLDWLDRVIFPAEARWADAAFAADMTMRVARQLGGVGTTCIAAYATVHHDAAQAAIRVLGDMGFSGHVGQVLMDQQAPESLLRPCDQLLREAAALQASGRIAPSINPRFAVTCTSALLAGAGQLAAATGRYVQTHLAETARECEAVRALHAQATYTDVYHKAGLLTPRALMAHSIRLSPGERAMLAKSGAIAAHCPTANRFLLAGLMDRAGTLGAGVRVSLGSDVAGGPDRSMVRVCRAMIETAQSLDAAPPTAAQAWDMITRQGASLLGFDDLGVLRTGARADVLVVRPDVPWLASPDPLSTLIYAWDDRWLRATLIGGKIAYSST